MASTKRKAEEKKVVASRPRKNEEGRPTKRQRTDQVLAAGDSASSKPIVDEPDRKRNLPKVSILKEEDRAFPRGGGGVLTPLEHKQIQIQATNDVLFEDASRKKPRAELDSDNDLGAEENKVEQTLKKRRKIKAKPVEGVATTEPRIRVEGLRYKRLSPGCMVLGQITRMTASEITLDLPNNLTGTVPITAISASLTLRLEALLHNGDNRDATEMTESEDIDLRDFFYLGQYLRACLTQTSDELHTNESTKTRKRIELSIDPRQANKGIAKSSIPVNSMMQASVVSVEDHGFVMDLGIEDATVKGFMSSKELPADIGSSEVQAGAVFLCLVTGLSSNGKVVKLSANYAKAGDLRKSNFVTNASTVDVFLPGTAAELLVTQVTSTSIAGQIMGLLQATADIIHSGAGSRDIDIEAKYKVGSKITVRVIFTIVDAEAKTVGVSVLDHVLALAPQKVPRGEALAPPTQILPLSSILDQVKVVNVEPGLGLFVDVGVKGAFGFVHISNVSDDRVESLSQSTGAYRSGTSHKARIVGYNAMDGLFLASLEKRVLEQPFLRVEDVPLGQIVKCTVEKLVVNAMGIGGVILNLAKGISGLVPEMHMADIHLQHPERKFKEGMNISARLLSTDLEKRQIRLTLKKSLLNSDAQLWTTYDEISPGSQSLGTLLSVTPQGSLVQFYGNIRAFLPVSEMSDAYIPDPNKHFHIGQVVNVHALSVDPLESRMTVSCRSHSATNAAQMAGFQNLKLGELVNGIITDKSADDITVELKDTGLKATIRSGHLTDGSNQKNAAAMKHLRIGQSLQDMMVVEVFEKKRSIIVTKKPSLINAARAGMSLKAFEDVLVGKEVDGFVRSITNDGVFVQFLGGLTALLPKAQLLGNLVNLANFGLGKDKSLSARVMSIDYDKRRFTLTMKDVAKFTHEEDGLVKSGDSTMQQVAINPVDGRSNSMSDFVPGMLTESRILSIKATQLNVQLADNVQGRIDVSEVFSNWDDIKDRKNPLRGFHVKQTLTVKVLGIHDARNHRFLPISHRVGKVPVFELTAKVADEHRVLSLDQVTVGSSHIAFVNNVSDTCLWVNLSPNVRGRIQRMDISDDVSMLNDLETNFPLGSAIRVQVKGVDLASGRMNLSAKLSPSENPLTFDSVSVGMVIAGRVTRITERSILVQLSDNVAGQVGLTEFADDYTQANPTSYNKNDIVRVCVIDIDKPNKKITLSTRPSKVLSSSLPVKDQSISSFAQLKINDLVRGFITNVADIGLFVCVGPNLNVFVRVSEMSDSFMKDWKSNFEIDRLVTGKIIAIDESSQHVQMSLKPSVVSNDYKPPITFNDLIVGQVITGKVRKVEDFGAFIVIDNSHNVSGLCHRSEIAEQRVEDVRKLYTEGDAVKAVVLKIEPEKRRISFGLKASYFDNTSEGDSDSQAAGDKLVVGSPNFSADEMDVEGGVDVNGEESVILDNGLEELASVVDMDEEPAAKSDEEGLDAGEFDWNGSLDQEDDHSVFESEPETASKKKRKKPEIKIDETGDLDKLGPRSVSDFERLLLGQRDSSSLWVQYMAFRLQFSEVEEARKIAERALREINIREQEEKMNIWVAFLNLENAYGNDETLEEIFIRACESSDTHEIHERLTSIYIESGKHAVSQICQGYGGKS